VGNANSPINNLDGLVKDAQAVLAANDKGNWTVPSHTLYPHQWLWDSCFVAIGLRHYDARRAAREIESLFRGQWKNGMLPHIVCSESQGYWVGPQFWQSKLSPLAPENQPTSGITQPPIVAAAALSVAKKLPTAEAEVFLKRLYPKLIAYHEWLYRERDPNASGLVVLLHPWESGMDDSPTWVEQLKYLSPLWVTVILRTKLDILFRKFRKDTEFVPGDQRMTTTEALKFIHLINRHRKRGYDSRKTIATSRFTIEDLAFNSILIAANRALNKIAEMVSEDVPPDLTYRFSQTETNLDSLWDESNGQYFSKNFKSQRLVKIPTVATFLPLFSGSISPQRAARLVAVLKDNEQFNLPFPVPSVAHSSRYFHEQRYWAGPTWINMNWMIIQGLKQYGYQAEAEQLRQTVFKLISQSGFHEYFSALSGKGYGIDHFSWTAALFIDLFQSD
jgi:hypothetical protein